MTPTPVNLLLRPVFVMFITTVTVAFCLQHPAGLSISTNISASTHEDTPDLSAMESTDPSTWTLSRHSRQTNQDCSIGGDSMPARGSKSIIKTPDYRRTNFYIKPYDEFTGLKILLQGWNTNSTLQYPRDVICISDSLKWYLVNIDISTSFGKVVVELTTNFCSLRCVTKIRDVVGPDDVQCMEVMAEGVAQWNTSGTPSRDLQTIPDNKTVISPIENCNDIRNRPNPTPHSNNNNNYTTTNDPPAYLGTPVGLTTLQLILILVLVPLLIVLLIVLIVVVCRKWSSRGEYSEGGSPYLS